MSLSVPEAQIIALFFQTLLYGIFFTLFVILIFFLFHPAFTCPAHRTIIAPASIVMMLLATIHLTLAVTRAIQAFILSHDPEKYYNNFAHPLQVSKTCLFIAQTLIGDGVMIWRCYVIYSHHKLVLLLSLLPLGINIGIAGVGIKDYSKDNQTFFNTDTRWLAIFMAMTLVINTACSGAIVYRIYTTTSDSQTFRRFYPVISATIESGILYVTSIVALIITFFLHTAGVYIVLESLVPMTGIVFTLMMLQIYMHLACSVRTTPLNFERTATLPTLGTLPRWRRYMTSLTERQLENSDSRLAQPARIYSHVGYDTDHASISSEIDMPVKGKVTR